jgi:hypothetical protein
MGSLARIFGRRGLRATVINVEGDYMRTIVAAIVLVASPTTYYVAKVDSFGCTSIEAVSQLQKVRSEQKAFQAALVEKQMSGECVAILQGTQVEGSIEASHRSILRVNAQVEPPGYEAPLDDFELKAADGKQSPG